MRIKQKRRGQGVLSNDFDTYSSAATNENRLDEKKYPILNNLQHRGDNLNIQELARAFVTATIQTAGQ